MLEPASQTALRDEIARQRIYWLGGLWTYSLIKLDDNRVWQRGVRFLVLDAPASNP
jgi:hypothetical protein